MEIQHDMDAFREYLIDSEAADATVSSYMAAVASYHAFAGADELCKATIVRWKHHLSRSRSAATVNQRLCAMRKYCSFRGIVCDVKSVKRQHTHSIDNVITADQYRRLIDGLVEDGNIRWAIYYRMLAMTGMRVSELLLVRRSDLDRGRMDVYSKGKQRTIIFPRRLSEDVISVFDNLAHDDLICRNAQGKPMTDGGIRKMLRVHAQRYGIPAENAHPHSFRHLFAINFLQNNNNLSLLADILGHSSVTTTSIYLRLSQAQQQAAMDAAVTW